MTHHELPTMGAADLHAVLAEDFPDIERAIRDFLVQRGGVEVATEDLRAAMEKLRRHIYLEEEFLFPALAEADWAGPVFAMSKEHRELWSTLDRMEEHLNAQSPLREQQDVCRILRAEVERHVSKEDPIVFGHAEEALSPEGQSDLRYFVENLARPSGWECREPDFSLPSPQDGPGSGRAPRRVPGSAP